MKIKKITPNIMIADVNATVDYYKNNLDFQIVMGVDGYIIYFAEAQNG